MHGLSHDAFTDEVVDFYCATNDLHPFREGNGRTQRAFLTQLIRSSGYDIHWSEVDTDLLMIATDLSLDSFICGFKLAWQMANELNNYDNRRSTPAKQAGLSACSVSLEKNEI